MQSRHLRDAKGSIHEVKLGDNIHLKVRVHPRAQHWKGMKSCYDLKWRLLAAILNRNYRGQEWPRRQGSQWWVLEIFSHWAKKEGKSAPLPHWYYSFFVPCLTSFPIYYRWTVPYPKSSGSNIFQIQNVSYVRKVIWPMYYILCNLPQQSLNQYPTITYHIPEIKTMAFSSNCLNRDFK